MMSGSKVVVTGGAGFIGSHIVDELVRNGIETYVVDDLSSGSMTNLSENIETPLLHIKIGDISNIAELLSDVSNIDTVFHEAAIASVPKSISDPLLVHKVNMNSSMQVLDFCVKKRVRRLVFASTSAVYGAVKTPPAIEDLHCEPESPYGASKLAVEGYLKAYNKAYGLETVALRYFNVFGPRQRLSDYSGVITLFINKLLHHERPIIYGDGTQTRDFVHVRDIVRANLLAMDSDKASGETFNVASGNQVSILKLFEIIKELTEEHQIVPLFGPKRPGDLQGSLLSIEKIQNKLGYRPKVELKQGLGELIESIKKSSMQIAYPKNIRI